MAWAGFGQGHEHTGHSRARVRMSRREPRAQYSVTMQGGLEQAPRNMTMLGWRSTLISCVSFRSSSSTLLLFPDLQYPTCMDQQLQKTRPPAHNTLPQLCSAAHASTRVESAASTHSRAHISSAQHSTAHSTWLQHPQALLHACRIAQIGTAWQGHPDYIQASSRTIFSSHSIE